MSRAEMSRPARSGMPHRRKIVGRRQPEIGQHRARLLRRMLVAEHRQRRVASRERDDRHQRRRADRRMLRRFAVQPLIERDDARPLGVPRLRKHDPGAHDTARVEARVDPLHLERAPDQQSRADEQRHRQRDLDGHQRRTQPVTPGPHRPPARAERALETRSRRAERGHEPEQERARDRAHEREAEHAEIDARLLEPRNTLRTHRQHRPQERERQPESGRHAGERQHSRLREQLAHETAASRPERGPDRQLPSADGAAGDEQVGDVGAGDEEHEHARTQQQEEERPVIADVRIDDRPHGRGVLGDWRRAVRIRFGRRLHGSNRRVLALAERHPIAHPADQRQEARLMKVGVVARHGQRDPELREFRGERLERRRHHADHGARRAVHLDRPSEDRAVPAEPGAPRPVADHRDVVAPGRVFLGEERSAHRRRDAERLEVFMRHACAADQLGRVASANRETRVDPRRDRLERVPRLVAEEEEVHRRSTTPRPAPHDPHGHDAVGVPERQRPEDDGVQRREHRRGGTEAERQRQHGHRREGGGAPELTERERDVLPQLAAKLDASLVRLALLGEPPALRAHGIHIAEPPFRLGAGVCFGESVSAHQVPRHHVEVKGDVRIDLVARVGAPEDRAELRAWPSRARHVRRRGGSGRPSSRTPRTPSSRRAGGGVPGR